MNLWKKRGREERAERRKRVLALLGLYLDDLLLVSGGVCFTAAAALRWGAAEALAVCGGFMIVCSVLTAKAGRR